MRSDRAQRQAPSKETGEFHAHLKLEQSSIPSWHTLDSMCNEIGAVDSRRLARIRWLKHL
jgi:hypothetical protein